MWCNDRTHRRVRRARSPWLSLPRHPFVAAFRSSSAAPLLRPRIRWRLIRRLINLQLSPEVSRYAERCHTLHWIYARIASYIMTRISGRTNRDRSIFGVRNQMMQNTHSWLSIRTDWYKYASIMENSITRRAKQV